jgi:hypothetical protein
MVLNGSKRWFPARAVMTSKTGNVLQKQCLVEALELHEAMLHTVGDPYTFEDACATPYAGGACIYANPVSMMFGDDVATIEALTQPEIYSTVTAYAPHLAALIGKISYSAGQQVRPTSRSPVHLLRKFKRHSRHVRYRRGLLTSPPAARPQVSGAQALIFNYAQSADFPAHEEAVLSWEADFLEAAETWAESTACLARAAHATAAVATAAAAAALQLQPMRSRSLIVARASLCQAVDRYATRSIDDEVNRLVSQVFS